MRDSSSEHAQDRHRALVSDGWTRRFTVEEPRLSEMRQMYESLGLEVRIETGIPVEDQECRECFTVEGFAGLYETIYTRGRETPRRDVDDELF